MITLKTASSSEATVLSNIFIDHYMPEANGEFVKVYIYLVRTISSAPVSFTLEQMADHLLCTERDILRALKYWNKTGLLALNYDAEKQLNGIELLSANSPAVNTTAPVSQANPKGGSSLSPGRIRELKKNEEIVQLLYIAEQYLGKTLTSTEMQKILYFYDELKLSSILIEYLIEYCVSKNHRSIRYMEATALAWAKEGITTVEEAKASVSLYKKEYFSILKYLGISGRNPVENEIHMMDLWLNTYGFTLELIKEACNRTVLKTGQPSFQYADHILQDWKKHEVHSLDDVTALDQQHKKSRTEKSVSKPSKPAAATNRFNNFQQREYDFSEYEKRLLNQ